MAVEWFGMVRLLADCQAFLAPRRRRASPIGPQAQAPPLRFSSERAPVDIAVKLKNVKKFTTFRIFSSSEECRPFDERIHFNYVL